MRRQVVVTGLGLVTPLGVGVSSSWSRLLEGQSGLRKIDDKVGGFVDAGEFAQHLDEVLSNKRAQEPRFISQALVAAKEALTDAQLLPIHSNVEDPARAGVCIGTGIGASVEEVSKAHDVLTKQGLKKLSPYFVPRLLLNLAAGHVSMTYNLQGPNHSCVTACASGAHSIGDASRFIMFGDADLMVAGGTESSMDELSFAGFSRLKALSTKFNDSPEEASRPFDKDRDGFVMGEGAGMVVLEERKHALKRGAKIYAELVGYGLSGDAFHLTAPAEDGRGARNCMRSALRNAEINAHELEYINAHATSTPLGDNVEAQAIADLIGPSKGEKICVSSTKGAIGHLLGAAGSVEAIFTILSIYNDVVPPTLNLYQPDLDGDAASLIDFVPNHAQERSVDTAMSNSFGFGTTNASLIFKKMRF